MKKYLKFVVFAIVVVIGLPIVSCDKDGENDGDVSSDSGSQIEINGVKHYVGGDGAYFIGAWSKHPLGLEFSVCSINLHVNDGRVDNIYSFMYRTPSEPKVGEDLSQKDEFTVTPYNFYNEYEELEFAYSSGFAKITAINKSSDDGSVTIKFQNLKMVSGSLSLTFNGTAIIPFNFD